MDQDKDVILQMIENTVNLQARNRQYVQNDDDMLSKFQDCKLNSWNQEAKILKWESNNIAIKTFNSGRLFYAIIILPLSKQFGIFSTLFVVVHVHNLIPDS